jgi:hypothetical protein
MPRNRSGLLPFRTQAAVEAQPAPIENYIWRAIISLV